MALLIIADGTAECRAQANFTPKHTEPSLFINEALAMHFPPKRFMLYLAQYTIIARLYFVLFCSILIKQWRT